VIFRSSDQQLHLVEDHNLKPLAATVNHDERENGLTSWWENLGLPLASGPRDDLEHCLHKQRLPSSLHFSLTVYALAQIFPGEEL
jgi:hypothetical protein